MSSIDQLAEQISEQLDLRPAQAAAAITLLDAGNTLPFVARYRKEATGSLDEEVLWQLEAELGRLRALDDRRQVIGQAIAAQDQMTPALAAQLAAAKSLTELEDLYQPFKKKRQTRASKAKALGLGPLADQIMAQPAGGPGVVARAAEFLTDDITTVEAALAGARDIVAEAISDHAEVRRLLRGRAQRQAVLVVKKIADAEDKRTIYQLYYDYSASVARLRPHQILAINRGETEKVLRVKVTIHETDWLLAVRRAFRPDRRSPLLEQLEQAMTDAARRLLLPAIERDVRRHLSEMANEQAIAVFAANLRGLLRQPPLMAPAVLGLDPAFRTGCKIAVVDATGRVLATDNIYPHPPQKRWVAAKQRLAQLIEVHGVTIVAIGNGTASRESEQLVADLIREGAAARYLMVNEAGASVYSASPLARRELPDLDVTLRGAVSIARRVLDPLAELVKIDPKAIGVGLYQHDVDQKQLATTLANVVASVVNEVGVDVNTASPALLAHVAGIGPTLAERIVAHRDAQGPFPDRQSLLAVSGLGPKAFEQAAGFLRVRAGVEPLDASAIHPESYGVARKLLARAGMTLAHPLAERAAALATLTRQVSPAALAAELNVGLPTLADILEQLARPGRDPRANAPAPMLRQDVLSMSDLKTGLTLAGTVRNVVDFGAFVDIGVKQDGLLHRSQVPRSTTLGVGDVIDVVIKSVDEARGRISLGWPEG